MLEYGGAILYILILIIIVRILLGILKEIVHWYFEKKSEGDHAGLRLTLAPVTNKAVSILVCMVAIIILLDHFGINIGSLLVSLGVGSLAVALAAQDTLANMIAGFVILIDRPFRVGDRVQLASGEIGDVQLIGLRSTRILNFDANVIVVPNAELVKGRITNYSHPSSHVRVLLKVGVVYGSDPAGIRRIMLDAAHHHSEVLKDPEPLVLFTDLGESAMEFTLITRVADYTREGVVRSELREKIYLAFQSAGIEIPFPDRSFSRKQMHDGTQTPES
jgi:small-conductance mechanosensitive channel